MSFDVSDPCLRTALGTGAAETISRIRRDQPRVHCLTNTVAQNLTANLLLAVGASPAMSLAFGEMEPLVGSSAALLINLGMLDEAREPAMRRAAGLAAERGRPWILDPVMVDRSPARLELASNLLAYRPAVIRGNAAEIAALGRKTDPNAIAADIGTVVAQTGGTDFIGDGCRSLALGRGHSLMARISGLGCALSALVAAFCAVEPDATAAAAQALLVLAVAGELAAETAEGPGSLQIALIDRMYTLDVGSLTWEGP